MTIKPAQILGSIQVWAEQLGFQQVGVSDIDLSQYEPHFHEWLQRGFHGTLEYMVKHGTKRTRPAELNPGTIRVLSARMDYLPEGMNPTLLLQDANKAYISRYALGRDYHKLIRKRLDLLAKKISADIAPHGYRAFSDSAPVLEKPLAEKAGLGWIGKHTNLINKNQGSWFFLGEIFTDLPLPLTDKATNHCGTCTNCMDVCPTQAIVGPYQLDARRCISYLTIELRESIPVELRPLMGNRIYGCDDCQLFCPWNKFAHYTKEADFQPRHGLDSAGLVELFAWSEEEFLRKTEGSAIRRIGHECWLRNIAVALGNALSVTEKVNEQRQIIVALQNRLTHPSALVREHVEWALGENTPSP